MSQLETLMKKALEGKATAKDLTDIAALSTYQAKEIGDKAVQEGIQKVKEFITKLGLDPKTVAEAIQHEPIFKWGENVRMGLKGRMPVWGADLKKAMTKAEALKLALTEEGKKFVENIYSTKKEK